MQKFVETENRKANKPKEETVPKPSSFPNCSEDIFAQRFLEGLEELLKEKRAENPNYPLPKG